MKIYTITCHNAYNYGAVLQAYAMQKYLESLHHEVRIIDYYPSYLRKISEKYRNNYLLICVRKILYFPDYSKSKKVFEKFKKEYLKTTSKCTCIEDIEKLDSADIYIAGSDQIWNPVMENGRDDCYFLNVNKKIKKISYAASVGLEEIDSAIKPRYKVLLEQFDKVFVREQQTVALLEKIGIEAKNVVDPVYLLPREFWTQMTVEQKKQERYIVVYALHHVQEIYDYAKRLAQKLGVKMYVISVEIKEKRRGGDNFFWNPSVKLFLTLLSNSEGVVSNSFHGISFAAIFQKPIHIFDTEKDDIRISNIVNLFQLQDRVCELHQEQCLENAFNEQVAMRMLEEISRSKSLFENALMEIENIR